MRQLIRCSLVLAAGRMLRTLGYGLVLVALVIALLAISAAVPSSPG